MSSSRFQGFAEADGRVKTEQTPTGVLPAGSVYLRGVPFTSDGNLVITADVGQQRIIDQGIALEAATGIVMYSAGPMFNITKGGLAVDANGTVVMVAEAPDVIHQGVGLTNKGELCVTQLGCFYVVSVIAGVPNADIFTVCFNEPPNLTTCNTTDFVFTNLDNPNPLIATISTGSAGPNCIDYAYGPSSEFNGNGPLDRLRMDYTPGTCNKDGDPSPECLLEAIADYAVDNQIWGPTYTRIGDIADDILVVEFPTPPSQVGTRWQIYYDLVEQFGFTSQIVGNTIQFTMASAPTNETQVTISHNASTGYPTSSSCLAADGRVCWRFRQMPVDNLVGISFWRREDGGQWRTDTNGNWILEN